MAKKSRDEALKALEQAAKRVADLHRNSRIRPTHECKHDLEVNRALGDLTVAEYEWRSVTQAN